LPVTSELGRPQQTCAPAVFFRSLPEAEWSPELNAKALEIALILQKWNKQRRTKPICNSTAAHSARAPSAFSPRETTVGHLESKPPDTQKHLKYEQETTPAQARWLGLSSNAKQIFARNSSEYIQFDEPETVIKAIREVYDQTRRP
jgi:hypothetical protein